MRQGSESRRQRSVATRVEAAQDGLAEAMRHVLAASSTSEASVTCDADG